MIKTNQARLITSAADVIYLLGWQPENEIKKPQQTQLFVELTDAEKKVSTF